MTEKRPLFRPEAVEHHARARVSGRTLDLSGGRTAWLFRGLLVAVALAVALAFAVAADTSATGPADVGSGGTAVVLVGDVRRVRPGQRVALDLGGRRTHGHVTRVAAPGRVEVRLHEEVPAGARGTATIRLGRRSVAALLLGRD